MRFTIIWFLFLMLIIAGCESSTPATIQSDNNPIKEMSDRQLEELKPVVTNLFTQYLENEETSSVPADRRIKDFIVHDNIQIFKNSENVYFIVPYDTLAASKEFVAAGGGEWSEDGWYKNRELHVVIEKNDGQYRIKGLSSGP
jgi:hypothetical protein